MGIKLLKSVIVTTNDMFTKAKLTILAFTTLVVLLVFTLIKPPLPLEPYYVGKIAGFVAFILFSLVVCLGLTMTSKLSLKLPFIKTPIVLETHQFTATYLGLGFMFIHIISFMYDEVLAIKLKNILIPFSYQTDVKTLMGLDLTNAITLGVFAFYLSLILVITARLRKKFIPLKIWRKIHYLSFLFYILFVFHAIYAGSDSLELWAQIIYITSVTLVVSLLCLRIFGKKYFIPTKTTQPSSDTSKINTFALPKKNVAEVEEIKYLDIRDIELTLKCTETFSFFAGQFISLSVGNGLYRSYSIATNPSNLPIFRIVASVSHDGVGSNYLKKLKVGDKVDFIGPAGRFVLPNTLANKLVFIATGTGIAPLLSMLFKLTEMKSENEILLAFGVRNHSELFYQDKLEELSKSLKSFNYKICFSQEIPTDNDYKMLLGKVQDVSEIFENPDANAQYFICGNPYMVTDVIKLLIDKNVKKEDIFHEKFTVSKPPSISSNKNS